MNIIVDKNLNKLTDLIDSKCHVYEIDVKSLVKGFDGDIGMAVEELYVRCVDRGIDTFIGQGEVCRELSELGIHCIDVGE